MVTYIVQVSIALLGWSILQFGTYLDKIVRICLRIAYGAKSLGKEKEASSTPNLGVSKPDLNFSIFHPRTWTLETQLSALRSIETKFERSRQLAALKSMLVEFQEAQCFFAIATQIAIVIANQSPLDVGGYNSLASLRVDDATTALLTDLSVSCLILTQFSLKVALLDSVYSLSLFTTAVVLSGYTNSGPKLASFRLDATYKAFANKNRITSCGNTTSPRTFCWPDSADQTFWLNDVTGNPSDDFSSYMMMAPVYILWSEKILNLVATLASRSGLDIAKRGLFVALFAIAALALVALDIYFLVVVVLDLQYGNPLSTLLYAESNKWTTGQIIAVTLFAPVMAKYSYTVFC